MKLIVGVFLAVAIFISLYGGFTQTFTFEQYLGTVITVTLVSIVFFPLAAMAGEEAFGSQRSGVLFFFQVAAVVLLLVTVAFIVANLSVDLNLPISVERTS